MVSMDCKTDKIFVVILRALSTFSIHRMMMISNALRGFGFVGIRFGWEFPKLWASVETAGCMILYCVVLYHLCAFVKRTFDQIESNANYYLKEGYYQFICAVTQDPESALDVQ